jgi:hypothetical protein
MANTARKENGNLAEVDAAQPFPCETTTCEQVTKTVSATPACGNPDRQYLFHAVGGLTHFYSAQFAILKHVD